MDHSRKYTGTRADYHRASTQNSKTTRQTIHYIPKPAKGASGSRQSQLIQVAHGYQANIENESGNRATYQESKFEEAWNSNSWSKNKRNFRELDGDDGDQDLQQEKVELCVFHREPIYKGKSGHCYGYFKCDCSRTWESGHCWVGYEQKCQSCNTKVYPYCMHYKLISENHSDPTKAHPMHLCGKCRDLGTPCYKLNDYDPTDFDVSRKVQDYNQDDYYDGDQADDYDYDEEGNYGYDHEYYDNGDNNIDSYGYSRNDPDYDDYYDYE